MNKNEIIANLNPSLRSTTAFLKRHGCTPIKGHYSSGYHYHSGFFLTPKGRLMYWSSGDDRWDKIMLFRTAKHLKDYTGGWNCYPKDGHEFDHLIEGVERNNEPFVTDTKAA